MTEEKREGGVTRLSFIKGAAAGATAIAVPAAAVLKTEAPGKVVEPSSPTPREPVMAYIHDEKRGEVTVMSGNGQVTYRDPALVKRLLSAAPGEVVNGGGIDVVAP